MAKLLLLYTVFILGIVFIVLPNTVEPKDYFLFSEMKIHFATHVYFICERIVLVILAYIIAAEERVHRMATRVFFWLLVADLADYVLSYNTAWFTVGPVPVSMNVLSVLIFGVVILRAWIKQVR